MLRFFPAPCRHEMNEAPALFGSTRGKPRSCPLSHRTALPSAAAAPSTRGPGVSHPRFLHPLGARFRQALHACSSSRTGGILPWRIPPAERPASRPCGGGQRAQGHFTPADLRSWEQTRRIRRRSTPPGNAGVPPASADGGAAVGQRAGRPRSQGCRERCASRKPRSAHASRRREGGLHFGARHGIRHGP